MRLRLLFSVPKSLRTKPIRNIRLTELRGIQTDSGKDGYMKEFNISSGVVSVVPLNEEGTPFDIVEVTLFDLAVFFSNANPSLEEGLKLGKSLPISYLSTIAITHAELVVQLEEHLEEEAKVINGSVQKITNLKLRKDIKAGKVVTYATPYFEQTTNFYDVPPPVIDNEEFTKESLSAPTHHTYRKTKVKDIDGKEKEVDVVVFEPYVMGYAETCKLESVCLLSPLLEQPIFLHSLTNELKTSK